jgi:hypothetical protein
MNFDWTVLRRELARWRAAGRAPALWWRDDDATCPTPALDRLEALPASHDLSVHLAVIPAQATMPLAHRIAASDHLVPLVHGWSHENHAPEGTKKSEFGMPRPGAENDLRKALDRMQDMFPQLLVPVFVPPWNRLGPSFLPLLKGAGYSAVSAFGRRPRGEILPYVNTHVDPIDWHGHRSLADPDRLIADAAADLAEIRESASDDPEPFGLMTHHLVHDEAIWSFSEQFVSEMLAGGACAIRLGDTTRSLHEPA